MVRVLPLSSEEEDQRDVSYVFLRVLFQFQNKLQMHRLTIIQVMCDQYTILDTLV